jgi:hypothetical protein
VVFVDDGFWPFAAIRNIKNGINPMAASERKAVIGQTLISLAWMTASGQLVVTPDRLSARRK